MGQIEDLRVFVSTIDSGGVAKGAETLGIAKSAVSRRLSQLEARYGVRLVDRDPRRFELTAAGRELYQRALRMVAEADELDADFMDGGQRLAGPLSISVPREFGLVHLQPMLMGFVADHPQINLTIDFDDRTVDLERENYDLAIRITPIEPAGFVAERLGVVRHHLVASPEFADQHALPQHPAQLPDHPLLHYGTARRASWSYLCKGKPKTVEFQPAMNSNSGPFLREAAKHGMGIARLPDFIVSDSLASGDLVPVLPQLDLGDWGIFVVHSAGRRLNHRMRALVAQLKDSCS